MFTGRRVTSYIGLVLIPLIVGVIFFAVGTLVVLVGLSFVFPKTCGGEFPLGCTIVVIIGGFVLAAAVVIFVARWWWQRTLSARKEINSENQIALE